MQISNISEKEFDVGPSEEASKLPALSKLRMLWKRRWLVLVIGLAGSAASVFIARALPSVYRAEAVILVDSQKIPENFVTSTVGGNVPDRLALITQNIMTSSRLLKIINSFGLYRDEQRHLTEEELLAKMHQDISVTFEKSWTGDQMHAFRLAYEGNDAKTVAEVTNRLAGLYLAENMRAREHQAEDTVEFLNRQLREAKTSLDDQEKKVAKFKSERNGSLPEQQTSLLGTLSSLSVELQGIQESLDRAQESRLSLEASLSAAELSERALNANLRAPGGMSAVPKLKSEILKEKLRDLRAKYTDDYPEVQEIEREIVQAERQETEAQAEPGAAGLSQATNTSKQSPAITSPELLQARERITTQRTQIEIVKQQIASLEKQRQRLTDVIAECKARIDKLPLVEQEMAGIKRNYDESERNYNSLLQKQLAAGVASDMERSQESERFTIVEPARPPQRPIKPKRPLIAAAGSLGSLVIGLLIGFGLEFRKQKLLGEWELPPGTVILGRVPVINMSGCAASSDRA